MRRLLHDRAGNTLALVAAATVPILGMVGGGIDMGRSYLSQSRLQQACDSGVLAARKKLGSQVAATGDVPDDVALVGNKFFNLNFRDGSYGTESREFEMTLEQDYAISGVATVSVPTSIMKVFGFDEVPIHVECEARLNFSNTDVMMVLDTTGSMRQTNPGDSQPRIDVLKTVVRSFHAQLEASKGAGTRIRYGFVPYSTNVHVGELLEDDWVVDSWTYQSRQDNGTVPQIGQSTSYQNFVHTGGPDAVYALVSSYPPTWNPPSSETGAGRYSCDTPPPASTLNDTYTLLGTTTEPYVGPPAGTKTTEHYRRLRNGTYYWVEYTNSRCQVRSVRFDGYVEEYDKITVPKEWQVRSYLYRPIPRVVLNWRSESNGCIEERATYEISDPDNVDFDRALDLDIDRVPVAGQPDTQWRPMYPSIIFERSMRSNGTGAFVTRPVNSTETFLAPYWAGLTACPAAARKLGEMDGPALDSYLASITASGSTYHDIGMIWGGRLLSPTGIFAADNADVDGKTTSRHMIFLTDGQTAPLDLSYGTYGVEPLDQRRWSQGSSQTLTETVELRFTVACNEVKKKNITVWVIAFGTDLNPMLTDCAGSGHYFEASDAASLSDAFDKIAAALGDLRVSK